MKLHRELAATYKLAQDQGKIRTAHSVINRITDAGVSARMLKSYLSCSDWEEVVNNRVYDFFIDMFSDQEAEQINAEILQAIGTDQGTETEQEEVVGKPKRKPKQAELTEVQSTGSSLNAGFSLNIPIDDIIRRAVENEAPKIAEALQEDLQKRIAEAAKALQPNIISINNREVGKIDGKMHKEFQEALIIMQSQGKLFLKGDAGTGKTFLAEQLADAMGLRFDSLSLTAGISEGYLIGRTTIQGDFVSTSFIDIYENGGVFLLDEVDAADANTLLILNKAISGNSMPVPMRTGNAEAKRHKDFYIVCAANTWGQGADINYAGREYLDEAFLNRFSAAKLVIDYDEELERDLLEEAPELCSRLQKLRETIRENNLNRTISTRTLIDGYKYYLAGKTVDQVVERITIDYTQEELSKVI